MMRTGGESSLTKDKDVPHSLDRNCVYAFTPSVLLRSTLLRALLAYELPLVLVVSGDIACRLSDDLPETHHAVVLAGDASDPSVSAFWLPQGIEVGRNGDFAGDEHDAAVARGIIEDSNDEPSRRPFLLNVSMSVNGRKPSRLWLAQWLVSGGFDDLATIADRAGLAIRVELTIVDADALDNGVSLGALLDGSDFASRESGKKTTEAPDGEAEHWVYSANGSVSPPESGNAFFALAPAGDVWSTGRILEAMLQGVIPIVDATYMRDGGASAKGCGDAAKFWRDGSMGFPERGPFIFVEDWKDLPQKLIEFGAGDLDKMAQRVADVREYRIKLEDWLRETCRGGA